MPSPVVELLAELGRGLSSLGLRWYLFGAQAAIVHGAARATADVDVTVELGDRTPRQLLEALEASGFVPRFGADDEAFVAASRVLPLVHRRTSLPVDVVLAGPGLEELFLDRAEPVELGGLAVPVVSAEDLVVMKILAGRPLDLEDAAAVAAARGATLDYGHVERLLGALEGALGRGDLGPELERIRGRLG